MARSSIKETRGTCSSLFRCTAGYTHICRTLGKRITAYCSLYWKFRRVFDNGDSREIESETEIPLIGIISRDDRADVIDSGNVKNNDDEATRRGVGNLIPTVAVRVFGKRIDEIEVASSEPCLR